MHGLSVTVSRVFVWLNYTDVVHMFAGRDK